MEANNEMSKIESETMKQWLHDIASILEDDDHPDHEARCHYAIGLIKHYLEELGDAI